MALIEVKNLIKTYQTGEESFNALNDVSFSIDEGEFVSIMGTSGSGKSTCMNTLGTLDIPTSGSYYLDGVDVLSLSSEKLSEIRNLKIGFVFQGFNLIPRTSALDNVELPMIYKGIPEEERHERARYALKIVGLENREDHLPNQMSGGQQQRVAIARAVVKNPKLLLCDEPTGALDSKTGALILKLLQDIAKTYNKTVIIVTHNVKIASIAERIITIQDGKIVKDEKNTKRMNVEDIKW